MEPNTSEGLGLELRTARILGISINENKSKRVCVLGVGNLGTRISKLLCSLALRLTLVDSGTVERANIGYQDLYTKEWVGKAKVDAARAKLQELYPWAGITPKQLDFPNPGSSFEDLDSRIAEAESLVRQSVCCVCCFDTLSARLGAFLFSYLLKKPFVNAGVQDESGSIRTWIPDSAQACPACMLRKLPADNLGDGCVVAHPSISGIVASFAAAYTSRIVYGRHVPNITHVSLSASQTGFPVLLAESGEQDKNCRICSKAPEGSIVEWFTRIY